MGPTATPIARSAVALAVQSLRARGVFSCTLSQLFTAANDAAWDSGLMLSKSDVWQAVFEWAGGDYEASLTEETLMTL